MTDETRNKISKIYELVNRGVAGEKDAAKLALDRLIKKHNLSDKDIDTILEKKYSFKYSNDLELWLFEILNKYFLPNHNLVAYRRTTGVREVVAAYQYLDYVVISTAYEYFRKHMMAQYKAIVLPLVKRCRSTRTKNKRRAELQELFIGKYIVASKLYHKGDLKTVDPSKISDKEYQDRMKLKDVKGGQYNTQVTTGLYLE